MFPKAEEAETLVVPLRAWASRAGRWWCLFSGLPPLGQLRCDFGGIVPGWFSGPPGDAVSYRILSISYIQPQLARVGFSYFWLRAVI